MQISLFQLKDFFGVLAKVTRSFVKVLYIEGGLERKADHFG